MVGVGRSVCDIVARNSAGGEARTEEGLRVDERLCDLDSLDDVRKPHFHHEAFSFRAGDWRSNQPSLPWTLGPSRRNPTETCGLRTKRTPFLAAAVIIF